MDASITAIKIDDIFTNDDKSISDYITLKKKKKLKKQVTMSEAGEGGCCHLKGTQPGGSVLACLDCHKEIPQIGQLKKQKLIFTQFWTLEVQD